MPQCNKIYCNEISQDAKVAGCLKRNMYITQATLNKSNTIIHAYIKNADIGVQSKSEYSKPYNVT